ncbi:M16 family metallopeptidase [Candidatus Midichloria mitochondrii]|uniref:Processing peptidase n=1 Tax=Midichloria mitochondrii (strain IricVA) TaxID=696127 RepID=F7XW82_MIDMI|nr:pitrilysin family protein [Candidatus Midichloria mitochondrii]AEI88931.1 processing peptidase [Candidatus Midichloria mitochondrii IricVA]
MKHYVVDKLNIVTDYMRSAETVSIKVMVKAGSRYENETNNGISHFLEHMAFKGTKTRTATQIAEEFDMIGGNFNAYTSREKTVYYAQVLKWDLALAVDVLADIVQNSIFEPEEIQKRKKVVLEELAQVKDTPDDHIFDLFQEKLFPNQALGRPIIGTEKFINSVMRQDLIDYIDQNYSRDNIVISCAGNFDDKEFYNLIKEKFAFLPQSRKPSFEHATYVGGEVRVEKDLEQVHLTIGFPGLSYLDQKFYEQQVLAVVLGGGMSSRLFQEIREKRGLAYHISTFSMSYADLGVFAVYSATNPDSVNELIEATAEQIKLATDSITEEELKRAKAQVKASLLMSQESSASRAERIAWHYAVYGRIIPLEEIIERIEAISIEDIKSTLLKILLNEKLPTVAAIGRLKKLMPYEDIRAKFTLC